MYHRRNPTLDCTTLRYNAVCGGIPTMYNVYTLYVYTYKLFILLKHLRNLHQNDASIAHFGVLINLQFYNY